MRHRSASPLAASILPVALIALAVAASAGGATLFDHSDVGADATTIAQYYLADDFTVATATGVTRATVWISELDANADLDNLNITLGWAIYADSVGAVGAELASGAAAARVVTNTGFELFGFDVFQVRFELDQPVDLAAGTYWFALHDGVWHSANDGTNVFWAEAASTVGNTMQFAEAEEPSAPTDWDPWGPTDLAFTLEGPTFVWEQSAYDGTSDGLDINTFAGADDFWVNSTSTFSAIDAWIEDLVADDNGVVDGFGGELSWAIFANDQNLPGSRVADGVATAAWVENLEFESTVPSDTARVHLPLGRSVTLEPGTYWLGLHEGVWPSDPKNPEPASMRWGGTTNPAGLASAISDPDVDAFEDGGGLPDYAFQLYEEPLFGSSFEAGTTCAWQPGTGDCP